MKIIFFIAAAVFAIELTSAVTLEATSFWKDACEEFFDNTFKFGKGEFDAIENEITKEKRLPYVWQKEDYIKQLQGFKSEFSEVLKDVKDWELNFGKANYCTSSKCCYDKSQKFE